MADGYPKHIRKANRLKGFDYCYPASYFITICTTNHTCVFGTIKQECVHLNQCGEIAQSSWLSLPHLFPGIALDEYICMPNHIHGILALPNLPLDAKPSSLSEIVRAYKATTTRLIRVAGTPNFSWQKNYWDTIIRNDNALTNIRQYIYNNPRTWQQDKLYPSP